MAAAAAVGVRLEKPAEAGESWGPVLDLVCNLAVDLPLPDFRVADLLRLQRHSIIRSRWSVGTDVPLRVNGRLIATGEFEVVGERLAVRLIEPA